MNDVILIGLALFMLNGLFLTWLLVSHHKLKKKLLVLQDIVNTLNRDMVGLCTASVSVDQRLNDTDDALAELFEKLAEVEQLSQASQPYYGAIQQAHNGASAEDLMQQFNMSRDEAVLLIRLHRNRSS
jgi:hypothetical protein